MRARTASERVDGVVLAALCLVALAFTAWVVAFTAGYCSLIGDDITTVVRLRTEPLSRVLVLPLGGQIVPLHRLVAAAVDALFPMRFVPAQAVLVAFHVAGVAMVHVTLQALRRTRLNVALTALYAVHPLLGMHFAWFSSGLTRMPTIVLILVALHAYVRHRDTGERRWLVQLSAATLLAVGFYSKAILVPVYCLGLDLASTPGERSRWAGGGARAERLAVVAALLVAGAGYVLAVTRVLSRNDAAMNTDVAFFAFFQVLTAEVFAHSMIGKVLEFKTYAPAWWMPATCAGVVALTVALAPSAARAWLALAVSFVANVGFIGVSNRTLTYGGVMAFEHRHYYELVFLTVLFGGIAAHRAGDRVAAWLARVPWGVRAALGGALVAVFAARAVYSERELERTLRMNFAEMPQARVFLANLAAGLETIRHDPRASLFDVNFPRYLNLMDFTLFKVSELVVVFGDPPRFAGRGVATHLVLYDGRIVPVRW